VRRATFGAIGIFRNANDDRFPANRIACAGKRCALWAGRVNGKFLRALPFELTTAQEKVIAEIKQDLAARYPMNRLLQGDVGSGKTVVAIAAILLAVEAGYQAAFMAPTQILAEQHYAVLRRWLEPLGVNVDPDCVAAGRNFFATD